jgi:uncharacterized protein YndB with AHSA1/START domain
MGMEIGCLHVRRSILIQAAPKRVWQEFETFERIAAWLDRGHQLHAFEPRTGGNADFSVEIDGKSVHYGGSVLVFEPERELSFESQWEPPRNWPVPTFWTFRLTALYDATLVEAFHHGFERLGTQAAENLQGYEEGWDIKHLKALRAIVES